MGPLGKAPAMRWLTEATTGVLDTTDPAIRLNHCRGPIVWMCWTTTSSPPVWPLPTANRTSPSKSRNPYSALNFMTFHPRFGRHLHEERGHSRGTSHLAVLTGNTNIDTDR